MVHVLLRTQWNMAYIPAVITTGAHNTLAATTTFTIGASHIMHPPDDFPTVNQNRAVLSLHTHARGQHFTHSSDPRKIVNAIKRRDRNVITRNAGNADNNISKTPP